jgi:hypothetical protein
LSIKDIAEKYSEAWQRAAMSGNTDEFEKMHDPSFMSHDLVIEAPLRKYLQHIRDIKNSGEILKFELKYLAGDTSLFLLDFKACYHFKENVPGKPGTKDKEVNTHYRCLFHVKAGKIDELWSAGTAGRFPDQQIQLRP